MGLIWLPIVPSQCLKVPNNIIVNNFQSYNNRLRGFELIYGDDTVFHDLYLDDNGYADINTTNSFM